MKKISRRFIENFSKLKLQNKGSYLFLIGLFFLPSAFPISIIFLFLSLIISLKSGNKKFNLNKINILFIIISFLMIFSNFRYLFNNAEVLIPIDKKYSWIDLFNWIPLFFCFLGFQTYLKTEKDRKIVAKTLLISSVPVIASCIAQMWFGWYGPFSTLNGLIVWFQKVPTNSSATGLFSNANYAGFWFASIFPFTIFCLSERKKNLFLLLNLFLITYFLILTNSRNAVLGFLVSIPLLFGIKYFLIIAFLLILLSFLLFSNNFFMLEKEIFQNFLPYKLIEKMSKFDIFNIGTSIRFDIFSRAIKYINLRPVFGWGASIFPMIYLLSGPEGDLNIQHTHNINLELAFNYGIPVSLLLTYLVSIILASSFKLIYFNQKYNSLINKSWFASTVVVILYNLTDVIYYDGKFSLLSWILLAGLNCVIKEYKSLIYENNSNEK